MSRTLVPAWGLGALALFVAAYLLVVSEEKLHLRKSKPVLLVGGLLWVLVALAVPKSYPEKMREPLLMKYGARRVMALFP